AAWCWWSRHLPLSCGHVLRLDPPCSSGRRGDGTASGSGSTVTIRCRSTIH
ncbi:Hypothetical predicted protein, partial [Marmota monax]